MLTFTSPAEQAAWNLAEALSEKAFAAMKQAEEAADAFRDGKLAMRRQFKVRGLSEIDADIRYKGMSHARNALADNDWFMAQARMYNEAAAVQYAKALYLKRGERSASS